MPESRRTFLSVSAAALAGLGAGAATSSQQAGTPVQRAARPMRILILGGTGFIGPHQVRYAVARGHRVTVFNRGKTNPGLFPEVEHLEGDRNGRLDALRGRSWDAVIDNPATLPRWVRDSAAILREAANHYLFVSTISVYRDNAVVGMTEEAPTIVLPDPSIEEVTGATYGGLKALAEAEASKAFPGRTTIVRPGLITGPGDETDRFTYWPVRIERGGEVLAPGTGEDPVQFIDARDLAEWTVRLVEQKSFGTFNALGPRSRLSMAEMLHGMRGVMPGTLPIQLTWVPSEFLQRQGVSPWSDMPVWIPAEGDYAGTGTMSNARAVGTGLTFRSLAETTRATLEHHASRGAERNAKMRAGISAEREAEVLSRWHQRKRD